MKDFPTESETREEMLLFTHQAARRLNISPETLWRWEKRGLIESSRVGESKWRRYHADEVERVLRLIKERACSSQTLLSTLRTHKQKQQQKPNN